MTPSLAELRVQAREHARQLEAVRFATVQDLAARWGCDQQSVRDIPRAWLPYLEYGKTRRRRYDPRDVEHYEEQAKRGTLPPLEARA